MTMLLLRATLLVLSLAFLNVQGCHYYVRATPTLIISSEPLPTSALTP